MARILQIARDHFTRLGFEGASFRGMAGDLGRSTGLILGHFKDKAELYRAATGKEVPDVREFLRTLATASMPVNGHILTANAKAMLRNLYGEAAGQ